MMIIAHWETGGSQVDDLIVHAPMAMFTDQPDDQWRRRTLDELAVSMTPNDDAWPGYIRWRFGAEVELAVLVVLTPLMPNGVRILPNRRQAEQVLRTGVWPREESYLRFPAGQVPTEERRQEAREELAPGGRGRFLRPPPADNAIDGTIVD